MSEPRLISSVGQVPPSPARVDEPSRPPLRVGAIQERWHPDATEHEEALAAGIRMAAGEGARLVCLQELTLSAYFAIEADGLEAARERAEAIPDGATTRFAARMAAETGVYVHASLYERADQ